MTKAGYTLIDILAVAPLPIRAVTGGRSRDVVKQNASEPETVQVSSYPLWLKRPSPTTRLYVPSLQEDTAKFLEKLQCLSYVRLGFVAQFQHNVDMVIITPPSSFKDV